MTSLTVWRLILISILALAGTSPSSVIEWKYSDGSFSPVQEVTNESERFLYKNSVQENVDGTVFCLKQYQNKLVIQSCAPELNQVFWQSPDNWQVKEAFFADLNRDGDSEVVLLVHRPFSPWPVDDFIPRGGRINSFKDKQGLSCHLILLEWKDDRYKEAWAGSAMAAPIHQLHAVDLDGDGFEELAALEFPYDGKSTKSSIVLWSWNGFGFSLDARLSGPFSTLVVIREEQDYRLISQQ